MKNKFDLAKAAKQVEALRKTGKSECKHEDLDFSKLHQKKEGKGKEKS